jgi:hypothetical protein
LGGGVAGGEVFGIGHFLFFFLKDFLFFFHLSVLPSWKGFKKNAFEPLNCSKSGEAGVVMEFFCFAYGKK